MNEQAKAELTPRDFRHFEELLGKGMSSLEMADLQSLQARRVYLTKETQERLDAELKRRGAGKATKSEGGESDPLAEQVAGMKKDQLVEELEKRGATIDSTAKKPQLAAQLLELMKAEV